MIDFFFLCDIYCFGFNNALFLVFGLLMKKKLVWNCFCSNQNNNNNNLSTSLRCFDRAKEKLLNVTIMNEWMKTIRCVITPSSYFHCFFPTLNLEHIYYRKILNNKNKIFNKQWNKCQWKKNDLEKLYLWSLYTRLHRIVYWFDFQTKKS